MAFQSIRNRLLLLTKEGEENENRIYRNWGLGTLSVNIAEERETVEDMYEPYLIQKGFIMRTRTGRVATVKAYEHMGYDYTKES